MTIPGEHLRPYLDGYIPTSQSPTTLLQAGRADVEVRFIEPLPAGLGRVYYPADQDDWQVVAPLENGVYETDAICPAVLGADGRVARIYPPTTLGDGERLVVGDFTRETRTAADAAADAKKRADAIAEKFDGFDPDEVNAELAEGKSKREEIAAELEAEKGRVTETLEKVFEVEGGVQGALDAVADLDTTLTPKITAAQKKADDTATELEAEKQNVVAAKKRADDAFTGAPGSAAAQALAAADGKSRNWFGLTAPTYAGGLRAGDSWFNGSKWQTCVSATAAKVTWRDMTPGEGYLDALNIGRGTAGNLEVGRLSAVSSEFAVSVVQKLIANTAFLQTLYTARVVVAPGNLLPDPMFRDKVFWSNSSYVKADGGESGTGSYLIPATTSQTGGYTGITAANMVYNPQVVAGRKYKVRVRFNSATAGTGTTNKVSIFIRWYAEDGSQGAWGTGGTSLRITPSTPEFSANTWTTLEGETPECPEGATRMAVGFYVEKVHNSEVRFSDPSVEQMAGAVLIEDGAVTASHITASEALSAKVAEFLKLKTSSLVWDTAAGNQAWITSLVGDNAFYSSMLTNQFVVSPQNLIPGVDTIRAGTAGWSAFGRNTTDLSHWLQGVKTVYTDAPIPVVEGQEYLFTMLSRSNVAGSRVYVQMCDYDSAASLNGVVAGSSNAGGTTTYVVGNQVLTSTYQEFHSRWVSPITGRARLRFFAQHTNGTQDAAGYQWFKNVSLRPAVGNILLENGAVSADKLAAEIVLANKFIAGPKTSWHTELDRTGLHFFSMVEGKQKELLRINSPGTSTSEGTVFGLEDPTTGDSLAAINQAGQASFDELTSANATYTEELYVAGESLPQILDPYPKGAVAWGSVKVPALKTYTASTIVKFAEVKFVAEPQRLYRATVLGPTITVTGAGTSARIYVDGLIRNRYDWIPAGNGRANASAIFASASGESAAEMTVDYRVGVASGSFITNQAYTDVDMLIEDVGPLLPDTVTVATSSGDAPPAVVKKTYTKTYSGTWTACYWRDSGALNPGYSQAVQGSWDGYAGNAMKGGIGFPNVTGDLSGATVKKVEAYIHMAHWWAGSGGTAGVGVHNALAKPSSMSGGVRLVGAKTAKPGGAWVTLPSSVHAGFKSGATRGLLLYPASNAISEYGYTSAASNQKLRITYEK